MLNRLNFALALVLASASSVPAQQSSPVPTPALLPSPQGFTIRARDGVSLPQYEYQRATLALNNLRSAQSYGWSFSSPNAELIDYLANNNVRKQLEFTDDQNEEFRSLQKEFGRAFKDLYAKYPELSQKDLPSDKRKKLNETVMLAGKKLRKEFSQKLKETLVPHQVAMVKTMKFNQAVSSYGFSHAVTNGPFSEELKTTDKQKAEIQKIRKEAMEAINKKLAEMKAEAKAKMIKVLDSSQKKKLKELEGEKEASYPRL